MRNTLARVADASEAVIWLRPGNQHRLELSLAGRIGRTFTRDEALALGEALGRIAHAHGRALLAAFLPGFSASEYAALCSAVAEFERQVRIEGERENPRSWSNAVRVPL